MGRVQVGPGTLYAMLAKFEENEMIRLTSEERRKYYMITAKGFDLLREEYERLKTLVEDGRNYYENNLDWTFLF